MSDINFDNFFKDYGSKVENLGIDSGGNQPQTTLFNTQAPTPQPANGYTASIKPVADYPDYQAFTSTSGGTTTNEGTATSKREFDQEEYDKHQQLLNNLEQGTYFADAYKRAYKAPTPEEAERAKELAEKRTKLARVGEALRLMVDMGTAIGGGNVYKRGSIDPIVDKIKKEGKDAQDKYDKALEEYKKNLYNAELLDAQDYVNQRNNIKSAFLQNSFKTTNTSEGTTTQNGFSTNIQVSEEAKKRIQKELQTHSFYLSQSGDGNSVVLYANKLGGGTKAIKISKKQWEAMKPQIAERARSNQKILQNIAKKYNGKITTENIAATLENPQSNPSLYDNIVSYCWTNVPEIARTVDLPEGCEWKGVKYVTAAEKAAAEKKAAGTGDQFDKGNVR